VYSDDRGLSWKRGAIAVANPDPAVNPNETTAVELADGRVMFNVRHESRPRQRGVTVSPDGVGGWSRLRLDSQLPDPVCMASLARLSVTPRTRLLFANAADPQAKARKNLTVRLSYDEGETWPMSKVIEPGVSAYSDLAVGPDGAIYCLYERGGIDGPTDTKALTLAKFDLEWLTDAKDR
jgi:sialidase-1